MIPIMKRLRERRETPQQGLSVGEPIASERNPAEDLEPCAVSLLMAIAAKDPKAVAQALYDAFCIAEAGPHEESQAEPHSYAAQNIKLGEK